MLAPQVHAIQTISQSAPPSRSPQRWWSVKKASSSVSRLIEHGLARMANLLDHLVRPPEQRRRDRQAERLRGLEVDDEFEARRL
jgi:hypothetical protein